MRAPNLVGDQRETIARRIAERYRNGETLRSIAADLGRSYGSVHALALEGGAHFRKRGWPEGKGWPRTTPGAEHAYGQPDPNHDVDAELRAAFWRT